MAQTTAVIDALKRELKAQRLTYAEVARALGMSEANIKRMFASGRITLERLEAICNLLGMELTDLFQLYDSSRQQISELTEEQERELVADTSLLLVAVAVRNRLTFEQILGHYAIDESQLIRHLAKLDRLRIIDLLPHNRIKLRIDENFRWLPHGPIEQFYEQAIQNEFLRADFRGEANPRRFLYGLLTERSQMVMAQRLQSLSREFTELLQQESCLPLEQRRSVGLLVAMRDWEFSVFSPYARQLTNR